MISTGFMAFISTRTFGEVFKVNHFALSTVAHMRFLQLGQPLQSKGWLCSFALDQPTCTPIRSSDHMRYQSFLEYSLT